MEVRRRRLHKGRMGLISCMKFNQWGLIEQPGLIVQLSLVDLSILEQLALIEQTGLIEQLLSKTRCLGCMLVYVLKYGHVSSQVYVSIVSISSIQVFWYCREWKIHVPCATVKYRKGGQASQALHLFRKKCFLIRSNRTARSNHTVRSSRSVRSTYTCTTNAVHVTERKSTRYDRPH